MEASFVSADNRTTKGKTAAIVALAVVGTFAACFLLFNQVASTRLDDRTAAYDSYSHWKTRFNFTYGGPEDKIRFENYLNNYEIVKAHVQTESSYTLGMTEFSAMTLEEFTATHLGVKKTSTKLNQVRITPLDTSSVPESVDWRKEGDVTPIKNQGQCGSCWAFSTTGALEGLAAINGQQLNLSEQELIDCSDSYGNQGCDGGLMDQAFQYVRDHGIGSEAKYPYEGADGSCRKVETVFKISSFQDVIADSPAQLQAAIAKQPVAVAIEADTSVFQLYTGGVISSKGCGTQLDHGVLAVGYVTDASNSIDASKNYYIVKNSWGASWGVNGYVNLAIENGDGVCGIQKSASYPIA